MMTKILLTFTLLMSTTFSYADENDALNFVVEKMVSDFQKGVEAYNAEKEIHLPKIIEKDGAYTFTIKKNRVHFTIVNYLNEQLYINDQLKSFPKDTLPKTTFIDLFFTPAFAEETDMPNIDGDSTKILLQTLSTFGMKLDKVGWTCVTSSCKKDIRDKNLKKLMTELNKRKNDCNEQQNETTESIARYGRTNIIQALSFLPAPNFYEVKQFMDKLTKTNQKAVATFMEDHMGIENKPHASCMQIMLTGTVAEVPGNFQNLRAYGSHLGNESNSAISEAKNTCVALEQLKSCLLTLHADTVTINNYKRQAKEIVDNFPNIKSTFSQTVSK